MHIFNFSSKKCDVCEVEPITTYSLNTSDITNNPASQVLPKKGYISRPDGVHRLGAFCTYNNYTDTSVSDIDEHLEGSLSPRDLDFWKGKAVTLY